MTCKHVNPLPLTLTTTLWCERCGALKVGGYHWIKPKLERERERGAADHKTVA